MKVLFLTNIPSPYRVDFFNALGEKCDLTVLFENKVAKSRNSSWKANNIKNFTPVFMRGIRVGDAEAICPEVLKYINKKKYDIFVVGMYSSPTGMLAIEYMRFMKIPFILSSDGGVKKIEGGLAYRIKRHFISSASTWLSTGTVTSEYYEYYGADAHKIWVYPFTSVKEEHLLANPLTQEEKEKYKNKLEMKEKKIILSVGQFIYRKGYDILLESCKELDRSIGIYIVGGKATDEYISIKEKYSLDNVHFVDFMKKEHLADYYKAADAFVLPTREDIWGLVINEAMSYALPVITTDKCVAGIEMINNNNGKVVPSENPHELTKAILEVLENKENRAEAALKCAKYYTIEKMAESHMECFNKVCSAR